MKPTEKSVSYITGKHITRRHLIKGIGVAIGLPILEAMTPALGVAPAIPRRFVGISLPLGLHLPNFIPSDAGTEYTASPYLQPLQDIRDRFTVISGSSHPMVKGGHLAESSIWSACPNQKGGGRNTVSIDQMMAKHYGQDTRIDSLVLSTGKSDSPSYTENGVMIPAETSPKNLFNALFMARSKEEKARLQSKTSQGKSILDIVRSECKSLEGDVSHADKEKLDQWFTSVREMEQRLHQQEKWVDQPKPKPTYKPELNPARDDATDVAKAMLDLSFLALQSDSTRFITLHCSHGKVTGLDGVEEGYHNLSHHGKSQEKLDQLAIVEQAMINRWGDFVRKLKDVQIEQDTLLDHSMVLLTSNLGNASSHDTRNMPVLFAGGGYKHGRHLAFDKKDNYPLPNLYLNVLQRVGFQMDQFATSTGTMTGLV